MDPCVAFGRGLYLMAVLAAASHVFSMHRASDRTTGFSRACSLRTSPMQFGMLR
jgi:hypothetical protein